MLKGANKPVNTMFRSTVNIMYRSRNMYSNPATHPVYLIVLIEFSFLIAPILFPF